MSTWKLVQFKDRIWDLIFDLENEKVNKLGTPALTALDLELEELAKNKDIDLLRIFSAKKDIFIAGADIAEIDQISTFDEAKAAAKAGQMIFNKLEALPFPTLAIIDGACLGGGMEFALACTYRICSDHPKTVLGLPEVNLGIIPGFGGTQRLPQLVGLPAALDVILTGKMINGVVASKMHLVDACFHREFLKQEADQFAQKLLNPAFKMWVLGQRKRPWSERMMTSNIVTRDYIFTQARKNVMLKTQGHYPAPLQAIEVIEHTWGVSLKKGLKAEREGFAMLAIGPICKNLIQVYKTSEALKKEPGLPLPPSTLDVKSAGVLGAGVMGGGIGWLFTSKNIPTRLKDIQWDAVQKGQQSAKQVWDSMARRKKLTAAQIQKSMNLLGGTTDFSGFAHLDVVVEAVVENMKIKKSVLSEAEDHISEKTLLVSNTSSLSVAEMQSELKRPENFAGYHFFNPVPKMPLIEVIPGPKTSEQTLANLCAFAKKTGKTPIVVQDCPGFLVNRLLLPYINEATKILEEGADVDQIDEALEKFGMPMGPFILADEVGLDVGYKVAKILEEGYGERMSVAPAFKIIYEEKHLLGKKAGKGFYIHSGKEKHLNPEIEPILDQFIAENNLEERDFDENLIVDRIILGMVNEAARALEDGVVQNAATLDMAMILGAGFPPFRGGLLRYADEIGLEEIVDRLEELAHEFGARYKPALIFGELIRHQKTFYTR